MKSAILTMLLLLGTGVTLIHAQRMLPGQTGIQIHAGSAIGEFPLANRYVDIGVMAYGNSGNYRFAEISYIREMFPYREVRIQLKTFIAEYGYLLYILGDPGRIVTLNAGVSGIVGYGRNNRGDRMLYDGASIISPNGLLYGAAGVVSLDAYVSDRIVVAIKGKTRWLRGRAAGRGRYGAGLGIRYNFY